MGTWPKLYTHPSCIPISIPMHVCLITGMIFLRLFLVHSQILCLHSCRESQHYYQNDCSVIKIFICELASEYVLYIPKFFYACITIQNHNITIKNPKSGNCLFMNYHIIILSYINFLVSI